MSPPFVAGRDVQKDQFVGPLLLVARGHLDRVAGVAEVDEIRPLDDAAPIDVETGNHAFGEHHGLAWRARLVPTSPWRKVRNTLPAWSYHPDSIM